MNITQSIYYKNHENLNNIDPKSLELQMVPKKMKFSQSLGVSRNEPVLVLWKGRNILAYASLEIHNGDVEISVLEVVPKHRQKGIGKLMLQKIFKIAKNQSKPDVILTSVPEAKKFYESQGFKSRSKNPYFMYKRILTERRKKK